MMPTYKLLGFHRIPLLNQYKIVCVVVMDGLVVTKEAGVPPLWDRSNPWQNCNAVKKVNLARLSGDQR